MWFLPFLVVGAIAMALAKRSAARKALPASRQLSAGPTGMPRPILAGSPGMPRPTSAGAPGRPGPISVLGQILRVGQTPPPTVVLCAIAEAQAIGRNDLASDIVQVFIVPLVRARSRAAAYERGSCEIARSPRYTAEAPSAPATPASFETMFPARTEASASAAPSAVESPLPPMPMSPPMTSMDDEISALLHADPAGFMEMVSRSGTFPSRAPQAQVMPVAPPSPPVMAQPTGLPPEAVVQMQGPIVGFAETPDRTRAMAPGSPIPGVSDPAWHDFVARLERESPQLASQRHVGQYRQRRERLAELGIDPRAIAGSAQAQRLALDADLADAHQHATAGGLLAQHLGRPIMMPGREGAERITLSGVLGVIQCAGLEGATGWLEQPNDRKRYPHTTQAFLTTNGVF